MNLLHAAAGRLPGRLAALPRLPLRQAASTGAPAVAVAPTVALTPTVALALLALAAGCAAPPRADVAERLARITPTGIGEHVDALTALGPRVESDPDVARATLDLLGAQLRAWGYDVREEPFTGPSWPIVVETSGGEPGSAEPLTTFARRVRTEGHEHRNLLAERRGARAPDVVVELGAHWDTVIGTVGADDDTSGVAALLEIAHACADAPLDRTLRFCFDAAEETGLHGSAAHVANLVASGERLRGALVMDMVGYASAEPDSQDAPVRIPLLAWMPTTADFIFIAGNWDSGGLADDYEEAAERYVPGLKVWGVKRIAGWFKDSGRSDHASYWDADLPAILLSDTANFRTPHYHQPSDRPETLDLVFAADVARAACAWALELATPQPPARSHQP